MPFATLGAGALCCRPTCRPLASQLPDAALLSATPIHMKEYPISTAPHCRLQIKGLRQEEAAGPRHPPRCCSLATAAAAWPWAAGRPRPRFPRPPPPPRSHPPPSPRLRKYQPGAQASGGHSCQPVSRAKHHDQSSARAGARSSTSQADPKGSPLPLPLPPLLLGAARFRLPLDAGVPSPLASGPPSSSSSSLPLLLASLPSSLSLSLSPSPSPLLLLLVGLKSSSCRQAGERKKAGVFCLCFLPTHLVWPQPRPH